LHTCGHVVGFFDSHMKRKEMILHICDFVSGFFIFVKEKEKWYYTLMSPLMQQWKGKDITHLWAHKWFFFNSHRWQINITIIHTYGSHKWLLNHINDNNKKTSNILRKWRPSQEKEHLPNHHCNDYPHNHNISTHNHHRHW
jgi:hypothetical protein